MIVISEHQLFIHDILTFSGENPYIRGLNHSTDSKANWRFIFMELFHVSAFKSQMERVLSSRCQAPLICLGYKEIKFFLSSIHQIFQDSFCQKGDGCFFSHHCRLSLNAPAGSLPYPAVSGGAVGGALVQIKKDEATIVLLIESCEPVPDRVLFLLLWGYFLVQNW